MLSPPPLQLPSPAPEPQSDSGSESEASSESDSYAPSEKKQKVNEESSDFQQLDPLPITGIYPDGVEDGTGDGYFSPNFPGDELGDLECWKRYWHDIYVRQGFDFREYPGSGPLTSVFPMQGYLSDPDNAQELKGYAAKALEGYNVQNDTKYKVKDILKLNGEACQDYSFYLTLTVKNNGEEQQQE